MTDKDFLNKINFYYSLIAANFVTAAYFLLVMLIMELFFGYPLTVSGMIITFLIAIVLWFVVYKLVRRN